MIAKNNLKSQLSTHHGRKVKVEGIFAPVIYVSKSDVEENGNLEYLSRMVAGMACAVKMSQAIPSLSLEEGEKVIFIFHRMLEILTDLELWAVILHEDGHIQRGHHESAGITLSHMEREKQADAWAVAHAGADVTISALRKTMVEISEVIVSKETGHRDGLVFAMTSKMVEFTTNVKYRIMAIEAAQKVSRLKKFF